MACDFYSPALPGSQEQGPHPQTWVSTCHVETSLGGRQSLVPPPLPSSPFPPSLVHLNLGRHPAKAESRDGHGLLGCTGVQGQWSKCILRGFCCFMLFVCGKALQYSQTGL